MPKSRASNRVVLSWVIIAVVAGANPCRAEDWPQWRGPTRDGVWTETGLVERFESPQLPIKWRAPIGSGYSGPTVAEGRVFVMDRIAEPNVQERVLSFDAGTGREMWSYAYDCRYQGVQYEAGPRGSVTIDEGRAYALGTMGHLHCLEARSGQAALDARLPAGIRRQGPDLGDRRLAAGRGRSCDRARRRQGQCVHHGVRQGHRPGTLAGPERRGFVLLADRDRAGGPARARVPHGRAHGRPGPADRPTPLGASVPAQGNGDHDRHARLRRHAPRRPRASTTACSC